MVPLEGKPSKKCVVTESWRKGLRLLRNKRFELYFIMGSTNAGGRDPLLVLEGALKGGITCFQLREKGPEALVGMKLKEFAIQCKSLCNEYGVPFIVNDDIALAIEIGADGVHIEQKDEDISAVREKIGSNRILGVTTQTASEAFAAADAGASYIMVGPVYEVKAGAGPVVGTELVREVSFQLPGLPIVGFGGISERKISSVIRGGASGVAVNSAIAEDENPEEAARRLKGQALLSLTGVEM